MVYWLLWSSTDTVLPYNPQESTVFLAFIIISRNNRWQFSTLYEFSYWKNCYQHLDYIQRLYLTG